MRAKINLANLFFGLIDSSKVEVKFKQRIRWFAILRIGMDKSIRLLKNPHRQPAREAEGGDIFGLSLCGKMPALYFENFMSMLPDAHSNDNDNDGDNPADNHTNHKRDDAVRMPDITVSVRAIFALDSDWQVPAFSANAYDNYADNCADNADECSDLVPAVDDAYVFNAEATLPILAGFKHNRRVLVQGFHGSGKSTHIEQVAARLNWACVRVNLDGHLSRLDLVGRDTIALRDGLQVSEFQEGMVPWAMQRPLALIFDEYDAGRAEVMFVIQQMLERQGNFTLLEQNRLIKPHPAFRLFATANTIGLGNLNGLYHGSQVLNQAQVDRWDMVATLNYLPSEDEIKLVLARVPEFSGGFLGGSFVGAVAGAAANDKEKIELVKSMVALAGLTRSGFAAGDVSTLMSPRTVISWAENVVIFDDVERAFRLSFLNKCDEAERSIFAEYYQRALGRELEYSVLSQLTII